MDHKFVLLGFALVCSLSTAQELVFEAEGVKLFDHKMHNTIEIDAPAGQLRTVSLASPKFNSFTVIFNTESIQKHKKWIPSHSVRFFNKELNVTTLITLSYHSSVDKYYIFKMNTYIGEKAIEKEQAFITTITKVLRLHYILILLAKFLW